MKPKAKKIIQIIAIATGTFSVAVLANQAANKLTSEEPKHKRLGIMYAGIGIVTSAVILISLNGKKINSTVNQ